MEQIVNLHIEKLPEGVYLATSDEMSGLVAQGGTITETLEITGDVVKNSLKHKQILKQAGISLEEFWNKQDNPKPPFGSLKYIKRFRM